MGRAPGRAVLLVIVALACTAEDLPPVRARGESLVLRSPTDLEICAGTFAMMEAEVVAIRTSFGSAVTTIDYSWMPHSHYDADEFPCTTATAWACTQFPDGPEVYARSLAETHELVHAARQSFLPLVLEEGLASVLEHPTPGDDQTIVSRAELLAALESGTLAGASNGHGLYQRSAHFVSFLFEEFGKDRFVELNQRIGRSELGQHRPLADWEPEFQATYGQSFSDVWAAYEQYDDCSAAQFKAPLTACAAMLEQSPSASLVPSYLAEAPESRFMSTFACADDDGLGPYVFTDRTVTRAAIHVIEIVDAYSTMESIRLTGEIAEGTRALLTSCGYCAWDGVGVLLTSSQPSAELNLPQAGVYALVLYQDIDEPGPVGIEVGY